MSETPHELKPSTEDWALLVAGQPSPWLRQQLLLELGRDEDDALMVGEFLDPDFAEALDAAGAMLATEPATILTLESAPLPAELPAPARVVAISTRYPVLNGALGVIALCFSFLMSELYWQWLIVGIFCLVLFTMDYWNALPRIQIQRAHDKGDTELEEALIDHYFRPTGS